MSETAQQRLSRMLALVPWLLAHQGSTVAQTAAHFGISTEQLVKDLNLLIVSGRPGYLHGDLLDIQYWDDGGHITVLDPQTLDHPIAFSAEEAAALLVSLEVLAQIPGAHARDAIVSTAEKLRNASVPIPPISVHVRAGSEEVIGSAVQHHQVVTIEYQSDLDDLASRRDIEPQQLLIVNGKVYVQAWCRKAEAMRTFRMDRVIAASLSGESFSPRDIHQTPRFLDSAREVSLVVRDSGAWVLDLLNARELSRDSHGISVSLSVADDQWLDRLLLALGPDLVQGPSQNVHTARALANQILQRMGHQR